jgi:glycine/D-amino acid oxidase-like deaminating enzyme
MKKIINDLHIDCDYSEAGWLRLAHDKQEELLLNDENKLLLEIFGDDIIQVVDPSYIKNNYNLDTKYNGRLVKNSGNYDPIKFIYGVLTHIIDEKIKLIINTKVKNIYEDDDKIINVQVVHNTNMEKVIKTKKIIFATNAFTSELFPELKHALKCVGSQIINLEHVKNNLNGITCTEQMGKIYFNFPLSKQYNDSSKEMRGMLHFGYDFDLHTHEHDPRNIKVSEEIYAEMKYVTDTKFPDTINQPPSRIWTGPLAFTSDNLPIIGFVKGNKNIIVAAGFQGFGGSFCIETGHVVSEMITTENVPDCVPENIFGYDRFIKTI